MIFYFLILLSVSVVWLVISYCRSKANVSDGEKKIRDALIWLAIILAVIWGWYFLGYNSASNVAAREAERSAKQAKHSEEMNEIKMNRLAREKISATLRDPDSAQFRNQRGACGEVNAKNSFGGYTGFKRFMVGGELNVIDGDPRLADGAFDESWNMLCGPNGKLATMFVK